MITLLNKKENVMVAGGDKCMSDEAYACFGNVFKKEGDSIPKVDIEKCFSLLNPPTPTAPKNTPETTPVTDQATPQPTPTPGQGTKKTDEL